MDKTPDDSSNPAAAAWESLRVVLEAHTVEFDVDALAAPAMAVGLHTTPICAFIIGKDGDIEIQVARAVVEWFPPSDRETVIQRTVPELLDAVRTRSIKNEVVRDSDGFIAPDDRSTMNRISDGVTSTGGAVASNPPRHLKRHSKEARPERLPFGADEGELCLGTRTSRE
ncbi:hypothetical protein [Microbacterium testaceum]|uniref:hypothetical protein n=1 Tax=Microbacterium testaceum TaxID=2033 RepID=UPI001056F1DA|nr:hypothetical protein [Microbacterium testaceum]